MSAENTDFDFGKALEHLKAGARVSRRRWSHDRAFLVLVRGRDVKVTYEPMKSHLGEGVTMAIVDHIDMIWPPSEECEDHLCNVNQVLQTDDLLADDWFVVEPRGPVNVYGPKGCGKTTNAVKIMQKLGLISIRDEDGAPKHEPPYLPGELLLSIDPIEGVEQIPYADLGFDDPQD